MEKTEKKTVVTEIKTVNARDLKPGWKYRRTKRHKWRHVNSISNVSGELQSVTGETKLFLKTIVNRVEVFDRHEKIETKVTYNK